MGKLTDQQRDAICKGYEAGETPASLARVFDISGQSVHKLLKSRGVYKPIRTVLPLSDAERDKIVGLYEQGQTADQIVALVQRSIGAVCSVLRTKGILKSRAQGRLDRIPQEVRDKAIALYESGKTAKEIIDLQLHPKLSRSVIYNELKRRGIPPRRAGARGVFWGRPEDQKAVCEKYELGMSGSALADIYQCSRDAVNKVLTDAGISIRSFDEATGLRWSDKSGRVFYMRSLWEIKTAKWLDDADRSWHYEHFAYDLGGGRTYTPDFWVYDGGDLVQLIDVKGWLRPASEDAIVTFEAMYPQLPFATWDEPELRERGILDIKIEGEDVMPGPSYPVCVSQVTAEEKDRIAEVYASGKTIHQTAAAIGRSHTVVSQVVNERGIVRPKGASNRGRVPQAARDRAAALYLTGDSITTVAGKTGLSRDIVYGEIRRRGIARKRRGASV